MSRHPGRRFRIQRCLGRGGFGEVYRATMAGPGGLETEVALKVLRRDIDPRGQAAQRLRDEGRLLSWLHHPSILHVHDLVVLEGRLALVTELVEGEDLGVLFGVDPPPPRALVEIVGLVASALDAAWSTPNPDGTPLRLVHRDVKPSNIRVGVHGAVKLLDFGIARADSLQREARTQTDLLVGSPAYMAPERFLDGTPHPASDVFALGATLYEGLTGRRFYGDLAVPRIAALAIDPDRYAAHLAERVARLEGVGPALAALVSELLAYDPEQRPSAAWLAARCDELVDALRGDTLVAWTRTHGWNEATVIAGELDGRTLTEGSLPATPPPPPPPRSVGRRAAVGAILVAVALSAPFGASRMRAPPPVSTAPIPVATRPPDPLEARSAASPPLRTEPSRVPDRRPAVVAPEPAPKLAPEPADASGAPAPEPTSGAGAHDPPPARPRPGSAPSPERPAASPERPAGTADPEPVPAPASPARATGRVDVTGDASGVRLSGASGAHAVPGDVPPGEYEILAVFNGKEVKAGTIRVREGEAHRLACAGRMFRCEAR